VVRIRPFREGDEDAVVGLWRSCDLIAPWNDPRKDVRRKIDAGRGPFLVATHEAAVVGSVMAGYDGHRGWINYLAVDPAHRRRGIGRGLMEEAERMLAAEGCPKINLQVRSSNASVIAFYEHLGYAMDDVMSFGKRLVHDG
jgi:ribosomal protein S18 acetylase RimI-like enzyme